MMTMAMTKMVILSTVADRILIFFFFFFFYITMPFDPSDTPYARKDPVGCMYRSCEIWGVARGGRGRGHWVSQGICPPR